ncbi:recombination regulator RecX, partial [Streptococcus agalactiae]
QNKLPLKALKDKLMQSLTTKGFDYQIAHTVIQNLEIEKDQELEEDLIYKELDKQYQKFSKKYDQYELKQRIINALMRKGYQYEDIKSALREYL